MTVLDIYHATPIVGGLLIFLISLTLILLCVALIKELAGFFTIRRTKNIKDPEDVLAEAECYFLESNDKEVRILSANAARKASIFTALSPRASLDILFVSYQSISLIKQIAKIYRCNNSDLTN